MLYMDTSILAFWIKSECAFETTLNHVQLLVSPTLVHILECFWNVFNFFHIKKKKKKTVRNPPGVQLMRSTTEYSAHEST